MRLKRVRKFLALPASDHRLLVRAFMLLATIRLALWLLPFRATRRALARATSAAAPDDRNSLPAPEQIAWAVRAASRTVPAATCLVQALAAYTLIKRQGYPASLRIGVTKNNGGQLMAHAWVESEGQIVIGGSQSASRFTPLLPLDKEEYERNRGHILLG